MAFRDHIFGDRYDPGAPLPGDSVEARWVNLRWRRIPAWAALMVASVGLGVPYAFRMAEEVGKPYIGASEITGGTVFLVGSFGVALWMVWVAPRVFTRQGVAADAIGIALIQAPNLWSPRRTVRIPWDVVHSISERDNYLGQPDSRRRESKVDLLLDTEAHGAVLPSWVGMRSMPASEEAPPRVRVSITPGNSRQPSVVQALRGVRPDLFT